MEVVFLEGEVKVNYLVVVCEKIWEWMKGLMVDQLGGDVNYDKLIEFYYDQFVDN